ncbi:MAG: protein translocase subunit SecD [Planctomycetaceae bacterium]|nr:protein translocase subunit SecD [Planctomycetaceae bacterium]
MQYAISGWLLLAQAEAGDAAQATGGGSPWLAWFQGLLILFVVLVLPFLLGQLLGRVLRAKDLAGKIGVVLCTAFLGLSPFVWQIGRGLSEGEGLGQAMGRMSNAISLGIDLAGGTNMVFQVMPSDEKEITDELMNRMVGAVGRRINPSGTEEITVRQVGADRVEVIVPGADPEEVQRIKDQITRLGSLEFAILANGRDHRTIIGRAEQLPQSVNNLLGPDKQIIASWRTEGEHEGVAKDVSEHGEVVTRTVKRPRLRNNEEQLVDVRQFLVVMQPPDERVTGEYLTRAAPTQDPATGSPAVSFTFSARGGQLFQRLTSRNRPLSDGFKRRLAILLDGQIQSAPDLNEPISTQGQISGRFTREEVDELVNVLNAGALEVPIQRDPISENSISPLLGADVREKGITAIIWAAVLVLVFMVAYYTVAGMIANLCLALNIVLVMGTMAFIHATFTLPGLAGIVLTIGMAVDANVLIFERMREERNRGSSLRMAIQNGFGRAFTTIVDANVTTLITAIVLYMIGTDQVRGFAVTLFIGIVMSMFTALYFGRLMFDLCERNRWITDLKMFSIVGDTHLSFISKRKIAAALSAIVIVVGMGALVSRGSNNLDIDFSGGSMVTFEFTEPQESSAVRDVLAEKFGDAITLEQLVLTGEEVEGDAARRYRLRTLEQDVNKVRQQVNEALVSSDLPVRHVTVRLGEIATIPEPAADETETPAEDGAAAEGADAATAEAESKPADDPDSEDFPGGYRTELTFSEPIAPATATTYFANELLKIRTGSGEEERPRYEEPRTLFEIRPAGEASEDSSSKFSQMQLLVRRAVDEADVNTSLQSLQHTMDTTPTLEEVNSFAGAVAGEMQQSAIMAMLVSLLAIVAYIWFRFQQVTFGLAAVAALVHDVLVVVGMVALASIVAGSTPDGFLGLQDFRINLPMIAAFLTIVGYSLNDTIVVFDRVREVRGRNPALTEEMVNSSLNQTLSRTILTSLTTFIVVFILYVWGGEGIHGFAFCLVLGVLVGTYSSIYVACPMLLWLMNRSGSAAGNATAAAEAGRPGR